MIHTRFTQFLVSRSASFVPWRLSFETGAMRTVGGVVVVVWIDWIHNDDTCEVPNHKEFESRDDLCVCALECAILDKRRILWQPHHRRQDTKTIIRRVPTRRFLLDGPILSHR